MAKILVADDSNAIRDMIRIMLRDGGHEADAAESAATAFAALEGTSYDVLIIDQNMPGLTGIEATTLLRANPRYRRMKIVILSADNRAVHGDTSMVAGADGYLDKPLTSAKLLDVVSLVLGLKD
jgi:two-component system, chemotaxis family, chemotaxis protein CheY